MLKGLGEGSVQPLHIFTFILPPEVLNESVRRILKGVRIECFGVGRITKV